RTRSTSNPPVQDRSPVGGIPSEPASPNLRDLILAGVTVPLQAVFPRMAQLPWGQRVGTLALAQPLHELPRGNRKNFPKFKGDGKVHPDEHIAAFIVACGVLGVEHEDIS
ncbi:hypothetical protein KI387_011227, partial [Taxus chinensis]